MRNDIVSVTDHINNFSIEKEILGNFLEISQIQMWTNFENLMKFSKFKLHKTNQAFNSLISLPFHNKLKKKDLSFITSQIIAFFKSS